MDLEPPTKTTPQRRLRHPEALDPFTGRQPCGGRAACGCTATLTSARSNPASLETTTTKLFSGTSSYSSSTSASSLHLSFLRLHLRRLNHRPLSLRSRLLFYPFPFNITSTPLSPDFPRLPPFSLAHSWYKIQYLVYLFPFVSLHFPRLDVTQDISSTSHPRAKKGHGRIRYSIL